MKVETNLAPGHDAFAARDQRSGFLFGVAVIQTCVVRMRADCCVDRLVRLSEFDRAFECATVRIARADVQNRRNSRLLRTLDDFLAIRIELRTVNVRMRVDEHPSITS